MKRRLFNLAAAVSLGMMLAVVALRVRASKALSDPEVAVGVGNLSATGHWGTVTASEPPSAVAKEFEVNVFKPQARRYPDGFLRQIGIERAFLVAGLRFNGQVRTMVPDFEHSTLYIDVEVCKASGDYALRSLHHEIFHFVDNSDGARLESDPEWTSIGNGTYQYSSGGGEYSQSNKRSYFLTDAVPGFISEYARSAPEEDKAELFSALMTHPGYVAERRGTDGILDRKVALLLRRLRIFRPDLVVDLDGKNR